MQKTPLDALAQAIANLSADDRAKLAAMLAGPGHQVIAAPGVPASAPVLERVIPHDYWWFLVIYVRELGAQGRR